MAFISHCEREAFITVSALRQDSAQTLPAKVCFLDAPFGNCHTNQSL